MCRPGARPAAARTTRAQRLSPSAPSQPVQRREGGHVPHVVGQEDLFPQARRDLRDGPDVRPGLPPGGRPRELRHGHARWRRELLRARQLRRLAADRGGGPRQRPRPARVQTGRQDGPRFVRRHQLGGFPYRRDAGPTPGRWRGNRAASGQYRRDVLPSSRGGGGGGHGLRVQAAVRRRLLHRRRSQLDGGAPDVHRDRPDRRAVPVPVGSRPGAPVGSRHLRSTGACFQVL